MTEDERIVSLSGEDIDWLTQHLGEPWVERFTDTDTDRTEAVAELCEAIRELTQGRHHLRADGRGCTCGWNGRDLLRHILEEHQERVDPVAFPVAIDKLDWSRPPGRLIKTWGDAGGLTDEDIATSCELPLDIYRGIVSGSEQITTEIARKLETGTHTFPANVWLMLERNYRAALVERAHQPHH